MSKKILIFLLSLTMSCAFSFEDNRKKEFELIGKGILSYIFWDVYEVSYFKNKNENVEILELKYFRDVEKKHSISGWEKGLSSLKGVEEQVQWLKDHCVDVKEGDKLTIHRLQESNIHIALNGKIIAKKVGDKKLYDIVYYPWIGEKPVDDDLRKRLLGLN